MQRVRFIEHKRKRVLFLDYTNCTPEDVLEMMSETERLVTSEPPNSVLTLSEFTGAHFSREVIQRMKEVAAYDQPYVKRAAFIGVDDLPTAIYKGMESFSARQFPSFDSREAALDWLVADD